MKRLFLTAVIAVTIMGVHAQEAVDIYQYTQTDLRGTARFQSMAGAFGALGGDISVLNQNPGGIGIYRSSDVAITIDLDAQSTSMSNVSPTNSTKFNCNNVGYVGAFKLNNSTMPYVNFGFTYNRSTSFNRHYYGAGVGLKSSLSNHIARATNNGKWNAYDLAYDDDYNPYTDSNAPWMSIMAYDASLINPQSDGSNFRGLWNNDTKGIAEMEAIETGGVNEFNFSFGGNICDRVYWGVTAGITDLRYNTYTFYGEDLVDAQVNNDPEGIGQLVKGDAKFNIENTLRTSGTGYNMKLGVIVRPCNELRLGAAIHTPTYYNMRDDYYTSAYYDYGQYGSGTTDTNDGYTASSWYKIRTPMHYILSASVILGNKGLLSVDYEGVDYSSSKMYNEDGVEYIDVRNDVKDYYKLSNIIRIGAEYRLTNRWSARAGYSFQTSPVKAAAKDGLVDVNTANTLPAYSFDNNIQYITCGVGYRYKHVYFDLAYMHKTRSSDYHAWSDRMEAAPVVAIKDNNNRFTATLGFRF